MRWWRRGKSKEPRWAQMSLAAREREVAHLRQVISTAKVVVALTAAVAATFVAGTLQVTQDPTWWDHASAALMGATLVISSWLLMLPAPPHGELDETAFELVKKHARRTQYLLQAQVILSVLSCVAATFGLLWASTWQPHHLPWH
jgi:hypothetical protein